MENNNNNNQNTPKQGGKKRPHHRRGANNNKNQSNANTQSRADITQVKEKNTSQISDEIKHDKVKSETDYLFEDDFIFFSNKDSVKNDNKYVFTEEELDKILAEPSSIADERPKTEIVGIRFKKMGKMYYFSPNGLTAKTGDSAIVETAREIGRAHV